MAIEKDELCIEGELRTLAKGIDGEYHYVPVWAFDEAFFLTMSNDPLIYQWVAVMLAEARMRGRAEMTNK